MINVSVTISVDEILIVFFPPITIKSPIIGSKHCGSLEKSKCHFLVRYDNKNLYLGMISVIKRHLQRDHENFNFRLMEKHCNLL